MIEKLRGYKSTPRHCEELCYEAAGVIESMIQKLIAAQEASEFDHSEYRRLRKELRKELASRDGEVAELKQHFAEVSECHGIDLRERDAAIKSWVENVATLREQVTLLRGYLKAYADATGEAWAKEALVATDDPKDVILCHAEPDSYRYKHHDSFCSSFFWSHRPTHQGLPALESVPLYRAWEPK